MAGSGPKGCCRTALPGRVSSVWLLVASATGLPPAILPTHSRCRCSASSHQQPCSLLSAGADILFAATAGESLSMCHTSPCALGRPGAAWDHHLLCIRTRRHRAALAGEAWVGGLLSGKWHHHASGLPCALRGHSIFPPSGLCSFCKSFCSPCPLFQV